MSSRTSSRSTLTIVPWTMSPSLKYLMVLSMAARKSSGEPMSLTATCGEATVGLGIWGLAPDRLDRRDSVLVHARPTIRLDLSVGHLSRLLDSLHAGQTGRYAAWFTDWTAQPAQTPFRPARAPGRVARRTPRPAGTPRRQVGRREPGPRAPPTGRRSSSAQCPPRRIRAVS